MDENAKEAAVWENAEEELSRLLADLPPRSKLPQNFRLLPAEFEKVKEKRRRERIEEEEERMEERRGEGKRMREGEEMREELLKREERRRETKRSEEGRGKKVNFSLFHILLGRRLELPHRFHHSRIESSRTELQYEAKLCFS